MTSPGPGHGYCPLPTPTLPPTRVTDGEEEGKKKREESREGGSEGRKYNKEEGGKKSNEKVRVFVNTCIYTPHSNCRGGAYTTGWVSTHTVYVWGRVSGGAAVGKEGEERLVERDGKKGRESMMEMIAGETSGQQEQHSNSPSVGHSTVP